VWLYAVIIYVVGFGGWTGAVYLDAWWYGGPHAGYMGFPHGQFSFPDALINPAVLMILVVAMELRRRSREARKGKSSTSPT
jgi:hypothetical protein